MTLASLLLVAFWIYPSVAQAVLPTPGVEHANGSGFAYAGTVNPTGIPPSGLPPIDMGQVSVTTTAGPGGATDVDVHGGILDVVHFGPGLSQLFTGVASVDAFMRAEVGAIHLAASVSADTDPFQYNSFPGALGQNPFYARAQVSIGACFVDVVTVPATQHAPHKGDLTTVTLEALAHISSLHADDPYDVGDPGSESLFPGASLLGPDGADLGDIISGTRVIENVPVLTPIGVRACFDAELQVTAGHDLGFDHHRYAGSYASDHAFVDALNTAGVVLTNDEGVGAIGSTGHDYGTLNGGSAITTTTTTTTTSTFVPPATLPTCAGYCGDGVVQADCAETCECPMVGGLSVAVCDAATATPALMPDCARCAGCAVDLSQCTTPTTAPPGATTSTTLPGATTTTTVATAPTTSTTVPCRTVRCILDAALHGPGCAGQTMPPKITKALDRTTDLLEQEGESSPRKARRLLRLARHSLAIAEHSVKRDVRGKKPKLTAACSADVERAIADVRGETGG
jgi:hypothetical protein